MDRTIPTDAELPEGPGSVKPAPQRVVVIDAADKPERNLNDCGIRELKDIPDHERIVQPPTIETMPAGHPKIAEFETSIHAMLEENKKKKAERLIEEANNPAAQVLMAELLAERERMTNRQEKVDVASEDQAPESGKQETGPSLDEGSDSGNVPVEARPKNTKRRGASGKGSGRRS